MSKKYRDSVLGNSELVKYDYGGFIQYLSKICGNPFYIIKNNGEISA